MTAIELLKKAYDLQLSVLQREFLERKDSGWCTYATLCDCVKLGEPVAVNTFGEFFSKLSQYLDSDSSYKKVYERLPENTKAEKCFKNFYRIAKLERNAEEHNEGSKIIDNKTTTISYSHLGTDFFMRYDNGALEYLKRALCEYFYLKLNGYSEKYAEQLLCSFFNYMNEHFYLSEFKDDIKDSNKNVAPFFACGCNANLTIHRRCFCYDISYTLDGYKVVFDCTDSDIPNSTREPNDIRDGVDIFVNYKNKSYVIPSEVLDGNYTMSLADFLEYEVESVIRLYKKTEPLIGDVLGIIAVWIEGFDIHGELFFTEELNKSNASMFLVKHKISVKDKNRFSMEKYSFQLSMEKELFRQMEAEFHKRKTAASIAMKAPVGSSNKNKFIWEEYSEYDVVKLMDYYRDFFEYVEKHTSNNDLLREISNAKKLRPSP